MFNSFGKVDYIKKSIKISLNLNDIKEGVNYFEEFIIYKKEKELKIYNRICDHAGGKIISKNGESICPMHNWKFDPSCGQYSNGVKKKNIPYNLNGKFLNFEKQSLKPEIKKLNDKNHETSIRFFNHAFLNVIGNNFSFSTDPWAFGPAFNTGWWLKHKTKDDWGKALNNSNFIYISHNHPDHLHPLTLSKVNKKTPIVVAKFLDDSAGKFVEDLGFKNIHRLEFDTKYNLKDTDLIITLFKSGDFREDSGIYFSHGNFTGLLSVDSNMLNFERYPEVDLYGGSFAGGASGYPLMFENYEHNTQLKISLKEKNFLKQKKFDQLKKIKPKFFLPYAGFFQEKLVRDKRIQKHNAKNKINDYKKFCKVQKIELLDVESNDIYQFNGNKLVSRNNVNQQHYKDLNENEYLKFFKKEYDQVDNKYLENYFLNSKFKDNLILYISLTDDDFKSIKLNYLIDFSGDDIIFKNIKKISEKDILENKNTKKILMLKVRKESFLNTIYNKLPWEDLLIGFQCKVIRNPNVYNVNFWYHFTNKYITSKYVRAKTNCNSCMSLIEYFDQNTYQVV